MTAPLAGAEPACRQPSPRRIDLAEQTPLRSIEARQHIGALALHIKRRQLCGGSDDGAPDFPPRLAQPAVELLRDHPSPFFHLPLLRSGGGTPAAARGRPGLEVLEELDLAQTPPRVGERVVASEAPSGRLGDNDVFVTAPHDHLATPAFSAFARSLPTQK